MSSKKVSDGKPPPPKATPSKPQLPQQLSKRDLTEQRNSASSKPPDKFKTATAAIKAVRVISGKNLAEDNTDGEKEADSVANKKRDEDATNSQRNSEPDRTVAHKKRQSSLAAVKKRPTAPVPGSPVKPQHVSTADAELRDVAALSSGSSDPKIIDLTTAPNDSLAKEVSRHVPLGSIGSGISSTPDPNSPTEGGPLSDQKSAQSIESAEKSFHDELGAVVFNAQLVYGPDLISLNFRWYEKRCKRICYALGSIIVAIAALTGVIQYSLFVIPIDLASRTILYSIFYPEGPLMIFNCWGPVGIGYTMCIYGVVLIQWPKLDQWKILGNMRWMLQILLDFYLIVVFCYFCYKFPSISDDIEAVLKNDLTTQKGLRIQMMQGYYQCCGINSYKDWEKLAQSEKLNWTGNLCEEDDKYDLMDNPKVKYEEVCAVPSSCWNTQRFEDPERLEISNWDDSCLAWELAMAYCLLAIYQFILFCVIVAITIVFFYLRRVIRFSNKHNIDLVPRYHFEECL